jgi:hypothetical protein
MIVAMGWWVLLATGGWLEWLGWRSMGRREGYRGPAAREQAAGRARDGRITTCDDRRLIPAIILHCECHSPERATGFLSAFAGAYSANMTTTKHMRTVLAAAAAGALVLGSAGGAIAAPKAPKASNGYMQVRMVNVYNAPVNIALGTSARKVKIQANVWDSVRNAAPSSLTVDIAQYDAKGKPTTDGILLDDVVLTTKAGPDKKSKKYRGEVDLVAALQGVTLPATPVLMCLHSVDLTVPNGVEEKKDRRQVTNKIGRDCFTVTNVAPQTS